MRRTSIRSGSRRDDGARTAPAKAFANLFTPGVDYRFEYGSNRRLGAVAVDYYDQTHTLTIAAGSPKVASSSTFRSRPVLRCDGTARLASSRAASAWAHLHDGTGGSLYLVSSRRGAGTGTHPIWSTRAPGVDPGAQFLGTAGSTTATLYIADALGGTVYFNNALPTTWITDDNDVHYFSYSDARATKLRFRHKNVDIVGTSALGAPSADAPSAPLTLARDTEMDLCAVFGFRRVLSAAEEAVVAAFALQRWGVTL